MIIVRRLTVLIFLITVSASLNHAQDLSNYRGFQFGMNLRTVAKQAGMNMAEAKILHRRPAMIQELWWQPSFGGSSFSSDPVKEIVFSFYNGYLFRMLIEYEGYRSADFTDDQMIEVISVECGLAVRPSKSIVLFSSSRIYNESEKVVARWEDPLYSYNLYRSTRNGNLGLLVFSKVMDRSARDAIAEAIRLDGQEKLPEKQGEVENP